MADGTDSDISAPAAAKPSQGAGPKQRAKAPGRAKLPTAKNGKPPRRKPVEAAPEAEVSVKPEKGARRPLRRSA
jgi:hypothetical protein